MKSVQLFFIVCLAVVSSGKSASVIPSAGSAMVDTLLFDQFQLGVGKSKHWILFRESAAVELKVRISQDTLVSNYYGAIRRNARMVMDQPLLERKLVEQQRYD